MQLPVRFFWLARLASDGDVRFFVVGRRERKDREIDRERERERERERLKE